MKKQHYFFLILAIATSQLKAQTKSDSVSVVFTDKQKIKPLIVYLDRLEIARETLDFVKPDEIQSFNVVKSQLSDTIYVELKKDLNYKFLSMSEIASKHLRQELEHPLFFVNDKLVTDAKFLLAENLVRSIQVSLSEALPYYDGQKFDLVKIFTTVPASIFIRGGGLASK